MKIKEMINKMNKRPKEEKGWPQCKGLGCHDNEPNHEAIHYNDGYSKAISDILSELTNNPIK